MARACWRQASAWAASGRDWRRHQFALEPIRLRQQIALPVGLHHRPGFGQPPQPLLNLARVPGRLGEQDQARATATVPPPWPQQGLRPSRSSARPASSWPCMASAQPRQQVPVPTWSGNPCVGCQGQECVGLGLHRRHIAAAVMQPGSPELGHRQTIAMGQHLGEGQRFLTPLYGLRWST